MARIRTIKPEFFTSEDIVELTPLARLLYIALWCEADKEGRLVWKPRTFKMRYLPADDASIDSLCTELLDAGLVRLYGEGFAYVPGFTKHQHVNPRESASVLPPPPGVEDQAPRKVGKTLREAVFERDGNRCVRCGSTDKIQVDHILPQSAGGPHVIENLRTLCRSCNAGRPVAGDALAEDLARDGYTIANLRAKFGIDASISEQHTQVGREGKGREEEGKGTEYSPPAAPTPQASGSKRGQAKPSEPGITDSTWRAYSEAYRGRYGVDPIRNRTINGQLAQFVNRIPREEAPAVAAFYVSHENGLYRNAQHPVNLLLRDCESLRTQWATGRRVSAQAPPAETSYQRSMRERAERMTGGLASAKPPTAQTSLPEVFDVPAKLLD